MAKALVMNGARALVYVDNVLIGYFDSCNFSVNHGAQPIHTLGRYNPHEITLTSYEAVSVSCSGFRIIQQGVHGLPRVPKLQDLLNFEFINLVITDRQDTSGSPIATIENCVPVSYGIGYNAKDVSRINITYVGTVAADESGAQSDPGATNLL
jgi:hypothetical protein